MSAFSELVAARIVKHLPSPDQPAASPMDIFRAVDFGSPRTTRIVLRELEAAGRAQSIEVKGKNGMPARHYRSAATG